MSYLKKEIYWLLSEKYKNKLTASAWEDIHKLKRGEHLDYLIGYINFLNCKMDLSRRTLIPRIETEFWMEEAVKELKKSKEGTKSLSILDIFSGSGCIGISILKNLPQTNAFFSDIEENCIDQIKINCRINNINSGRYKIVKSDIFKNISKDKKFNFIFANPPYIPTHSKDIENSVLINEPAVALFGGKDGLKYIDMFLKDAKKFLEKDGKIYMEFDHPQKSEVEDILKKYNYKDYNFRKDQFDKYRFLIIGNDK